jgi:lambda family phage tail tape measure protein
LKLGTAERAAAIQMRGLDEASVRRWGDAVVEANRQIENSQRTIDAMDDFRDSAEDFLVDLPTKGKEAWRDFFEDLSTQLRRWAAKGVIEQLFGAQGTSGQGTTGGGWLGALVGAFTGSGGSNNATIFDGLWSGFASGGYTGNMPRNQVAGVVHGGEYVLNAQATQMLGPAFLDRLNRGQAPAAPATSQRPLGHADVHQTIIVQGKIDNRTAEQIAKQSGREITTAMRRNG